MVDVIKFAYIHYILWLVENGIAPILFTLELSISLLIGEIFYSDVQEKQYLSHVKINIQNLMH